MPPSSLTAPDTYANFLFLEHPMLITTPKPFWTSGFFFLNRSSPGSLHNPPLFIFQVSTQHFTISDRMSCTLLCKLIPSTLLFPIHNILFIPLIATGKMRFSCLLITCTSPPLQCKFHEGRDYIYPITPVAFGSRIVPGKSSVFHHLSGKLKGQ